MGHESKSFSLTIAEMREFAGFTEAEQEFIERSLDIALARNDAFKTWSQSMADQCAIRSQYIAYRELKQLRALIPTDEGFEGLEPFMGTLTRISAQDLAMNKIESFSAYRFLYERLLGAASRPYLPAAFCGAAALPQVHPSSRRKLLQSLSEAAATAPAWSQREPSFFPERIEAEAA